MGDTVVVFGAGWEGDVTDAAEPVLDSAAAIVEDGQRRRIPVSADGSHGRPAGYARDRIHTERGRDARSPYRDVGSDAETPDGYPYPLGLELGTPPHTIEPKGVREDGKPYPLRNKKTGQVFGYSVNHPGTQPYPWCRAALQDLAGRVL